MIACPLVKDGPPGRGAARARRPHQRLRAIVCSRRFSTRERRSSRWLLFDVNDLTMLKGRESMESCARV